MSQGSDNAAIPDPAEATDGSVLGEHVGDETLPGTVGYPPTDPVGVGPANSATDADHHDSIAGRSDREQAEDPPPPPSQGVCVGFAR